MKEKLKSTSFIMAYIAIFFILFNIVHWGNVTTTQKQKYNDQIEQVGKETLNSLIEIATSSMSTSEKAVKFDFITAKGQSALIQDTDTRVKDGAIAIVKYNNDDEGNKNIYRIVSISNTFGTSESINEYYQSLDGSYEDAIPRIALTQDIIDLYNKNSDKQLIVQSGAFNGDTFYPTQVAIRTINSDGTASDSSPTVIEQPSVNDSYGFYAPKTYSALEIYGFSDKLSEKFETEIQKAAVSNQSIDNVYWFTQKMLDENYAVVIRCNKFSLSFGSIFFGIMMDLAILGIAFLLFVMLNNRENFPKIKTSLKAGQFKIKEETPEEVPATEEVPEDLKVETVEEKTDKTEILAKINEIIGITEKELSKKPKNADSLGFVSVKYKTAANEIKEGRPINHIVNGCAKIYSESCNKEDALLVKLTEFEELIRKELL